MDGNQQNQQTPQPKQPRPLSFLQGLEWTSGGVAIGVGFFTLLFIVLNYFNILPLSKAYPNSLGWLPHRPYANSKIQSSIPKQVNQPTSSSTPQLFSNAFLENKTKQELPVFIQSLLQPAFMPASFDIKPTADLNGRVLDPNRFNAFWQTKDGVSVNVSMRYNVQGEIEDKYISFTLPSATNNLTASMGKTLASAYFKQNTEIAWQCETVDLRDKAHTKGVICESFEEINNKSKVKKGLGVMAPIPGDSQKTDVFYCEIYPSTPDYQRQSCNIYKSGLF